MQQLRGFVAHRTDLNDAAPIDVCSVIEEATALALAVGSARPTIHRDLPKLPPVLGVGESLSQAFGNVVSNAIEASANHTDPQVWLSASVVWPLAAGLTRQGWIDVRIRDNGPGIAEDQREHIFEPFFSTKVRRSGMGLGLAITRQIITAHLGTIGVAESSMQGTTFVIRLPLASDEQAR
ncbi:MAG: HAMP domain-containing histidine kinase [Deltaproteobacteria bacterium]|nr:HAMP domain-containing histidine kinase [Deltaproteobacteria bacterium]